MKGEQTVSAELTRDQIINLISPSSKNSEHHDLAFANRVIDAMRDLTQRPAAQAEREAFEAWALATHGKFALSGDDAGSMWDAWQARASLPAPQQGIACNNPTPEPEFDDCSSSPTGKHSESWFGNGDCDHCKTGAQNAPMAATPEPVGEVVAWVDRHDRTELYWRKPEQVDVRPLVYGDTRPAPGVQELTDAMLVAGLKVCEPLGELIDWREGFGRDEMRAVWNDMLAAAQAKGEQA